MQSSYQPRSTMSMGGGMASSSSTAASTSDIPTHRPSGEPIPISEQLMQVDQAITLTLQEIDANFAKSHQIITGRILPSIRRYGVASHNTWQGARFWHRFFETASDINLVPTYGEEEATLQEDEGQTSTSYGPQDRELSASTSLNNDGTDDLTDEGNGELSQIDDSGEFNEQDFEEPPRLSEASLAATGRSNGMRQRQAIWAPVESPFEQLKRDVDSDFSFAQSGSPDAASGHQRAQAGRGEEIGEMEQLPKTTPRKAGASRLATQVLRSQHEQQKKNARKVQATPKRGTTNQGNPFTNGKEALSHRKENHQKWNGIADLRKTPLAKVKAESRKGKDFDLNHNNDEGDDSLAWPEGMSPPVTMRMQLPQSKYNKTPAKDAARLVVDDLLRTVEGASPATRRRIVQNRDLYGTHKSRQATHVGAGLVSTPLRKGTKSSRKSLPTPPTVTKRFGRSEQHFETPAGISSSKLLDEDEGGDEFVGRKTAEDDEEVEPDLGTGLSRLALSQTSVSIDKLLHVNDDDDEDDSSGEEQSDSDSEEENRLQQTSRSAILKGSGPRNNHDYPTGSSLVSNSRSIDQDTLFGIRDPQSNKGRSIGSGLGPSALKSAIKFSSSSSSDAPPTSSSNRNTSQSSYQPYNADLHEMGTVYGGRPLLGDDREDTYSAPSPTPATAQIWKR